MKHQLAVGQKVFLDMKSYLSNELREVTIKSVGKKFFTIKEEKRLRFSIETLRKDTNIGYAGKIYLTRQDYDNEIELAKLNTLLRRKFEYNNSFSLD